MLTYSERFNISMTVIGYAAFIASLIILAFILANIMILIIKAVISTIRDYQDEKLSEELNHIDDDYLLEKEIIVIDDQLIELTPVDIILKELDRVNIWWVN